MYNKTVTMQQDCFVIQSLIKQSLQITTDLNHHQNYHVYTCLEATMGHKVQCFFVTPQAIQAWCMAIVGTAIGIFPKLLPYFRPKYASFPNLFQT